MRHMTHHLLAITTAGWAYGDMKDLLPAAVVVVKIANEMIAVEGEGVVEEIGTVMEEGDRQSGGHQRQTRETRQVLRDHCHPPPWLSLALQANTQMGPLMRLQVLTSLSLITAKTGTTRNFHSPNLTGSTLTINNHTYNPI